MNNDSSSSARPADLPISSPVQPDDNDNNNTDTVAPPPEDEKTVAQKRLQAVIQKKNDFLAHLLENLDSITYMELALLYYMEYATILHMTICCCSY